MLALKRILASLAFAASALAACEAAAYNSLVVFGDSLSDNGNLYSMVGYPPSPPYYQGRFSNGPVAVEYMAATLGLTLSDYAVGGAMNGTSNYLNPSLPGIQSEIVAYATAHPAVPDPAGTLFFVWGGANDFFYGLDNGIDPTVFIPAALNAMATDLTTLIGLGATHILVPGLPDLGITPFGLSNGPGASLLLSTLSNAYNTNLAALLAALSSGGVEIDTFDTAAFLNSVAANPAAYGFTNATSPCFDGTSIVGDCSNFLFWDSVHPTTAAHVLLAQEFAASVPEPSSVILVGLALVFLWLTARMSRRTDAVPANEPWSGCL